MELLDQALLVPDNEEAVLDLLDNVCYLDVVPDESVERCVFYIHE